MCHFEERHLKIDARRNVRCYNTGFVAVSSRLVLRGNNGYLASVRPHNNYLRVVLAEEYAVKRGLHEMFECDGFAGCTQVAEQYALADEAFLPEFMQSSQKFLARRKGRDADGRSADLLENPLNNVGQLNALGEIRLSSRFLQGLQFDEYLVSHYSNDMPIALSSSTVASENSAPAFRMTLTAA